MPLVPSILLAVSVASAIASWVLGFRRAVLFLTVGLVSIGVIMLFSSRDGLEMFLILGPFILPAAIGASICGVFAGALFKTKWFPLGLAFLLPPLLFFNDTRATADNEKDTQWRGLVFINSEPRLAKLMGQPVQAELATWSKNQHGQIFRLEYSFPGHSSMYAIVEVTHGQAAPTFRLACLTSIYMGQRDVHKDVCAQGVIPLPEKL